MPWWNPLSQIRAMFVRSIMARLLKPLLAGPDVIVLEHILPFLRSIQFVPGIVSRIQTNKRNHWLYNRLISSQSSGSLRHVYLLKIEFGDKIFKNLFCEYHESRLTILWWRYFEICEFVRLLYSGRGKGGSIASGSYGCSSIHNISSSERQEWSDRFEPPK